MQMRPFSLAAARTEPVRRRSELVDGLSNKCEGTRGEKRGDGGTEEEAERTKTKTGTTRPGPVYPCLYYMLLYEEPFLSSTQRSTWRPSCETRPVPSGHAIHTLKSSYDSSYI